MEKKKVRFGLMAKLLVGIIPVVLIGINIVSYVSGQMASNAINATTDSRMKAEVTAQLNDIDGKLQEIRTSAELLSLIVGDTYKTTDIAAYADIFSDVVMNNELILGSGIWFEPLVYTGDQKYAFQRYVGPYWYKDGNSIVEDWEYSNAEYDYFNQEYYLNAKNSKTQKAMITDPYYDEASGSIMATCSSAIYDMFGQYIGCITVDLSLDTISNMVSSIKIGKTGTAMMVAADGTYIYTPDSSKIASAMKLSEDKDAISATAKDVLASESGKTGFKAAAGQKTVYFGTVSEVNWKLLLLMDESEINEASTQMIGVTVPISIAVMVISIVTVLILAKVFTKSVKVAQNFADTLASGDFTVEEIEISSHDEVGAMSTSLNDMYRSNKKIISDISDEAGNINDAASTLSAMSEELSAEFSRIQENMVNVNEAMMNSSAATEEVSASVTEVNNAVTRLAEETERITDEVKTITERATRVQLDSREAHDSAIKLAEEREKELTEARAKATVVKEIENLANVINDIASEIDLLSLNASIEAARAGEAGRGFAVVAQQINKLATETAEAVHQIQETVSSIQDAFAELGESSEKLLEFVTETATPDYSKFTEIGRQYGDDANLFGELSDKIAEMIQSIKMTMDEVNMAVQNIASGTEETAGRSSDVTESVNSATSAVESIAEQATAQQFTASNLKDIVGRFKLR